MCKLPTRVFLLELILDTSHPITRPFLVPHLLVCFLAAFSMQMLRRLPSLESDCSPRVACRHDTASSFNCCLWTRPTLLALCPSSLFDPLLLELQISSNLQESCQSACSLSSLSTLTAIVCPWILIHRQLSFPWNLGYYHIRPQGYQEGHSSTFNPL